MCRDLTNFRPTKYKKADKSVLALFPYTSNASNTLSGLLKGEGSSENKSRGTAFLSQAPAEKKGSPKLVVCPTREPAQVST